MNLPEPARPGFAAKLWRRPQRSFLLGIPAGALLAFIVGIGFTGGFIGALQFASTEASCISCHEMNAPFHELAHSVHASNEFGVRASCADCHVPPAFLPGLMRHMAASVEIWGHVTGELDTPAKYDAWHSHRKSGRSWKRMIPPSAEAVIRRPQWHSPARPPQPPYLQQPCTSHWHPAIPASTATRA